LHDFFLNTLCYLYLNTDQFNFLIKIKVYTLTKKDFLSRLILIVIRLSDIFQRLHYQCILMSNVNNQTIDSDNPKLFLN